MTLKRRATVYLFTVLILAAYSEPAASAQQTTSKPQSNAEAAKKQPPHLPVYEVVETGATASKAAALASHLGITSKDILSESGAIVFVDTARFLFVPEKKVADSQRVREAIEGTRTKDATRKITPKILNAGAIGDLRLLSEKSALSKTALAFAAAGLTLQFGKASVGHHQLSLYTMDGKRSIIRDGSPIDTEVTYRFTDPKGYPIYGPGAQAQLNFDATGHVNRVYYAARKLKEVGSVQVIPREEAHEQIARLLPPKSAITSRLVYFAPPLASRERSRVATLIPWYAYYGNTRVTNPHTGVVSEMKSRIGFIPATRDERFVPAVRLAADGGSEVNASVSVHGGRPPYRYLWGASNPSISETVEPSIRYSPQVRATEALLRDPYFNLHRDERLSVTVVDSNGISVHVMKRCR